MEHKENMENKVIKTKENIVRDATEKEMNVIIPTLMTTSVAEQERWKE